MSTHPLTPECLRRADATSYAYLLGIYLGDGYLSASGSSASLQIALDLRYPSIIEECIKAIEVLVPSSDVGRYARPGSVRLQVTSAALLEMFPQHGPGRKHMRSIELTDWQLQITHDHPRELLRGLIHSDGCRSINRFTTELPSGKVASYRYPRYFFSNLSADIRSIFCKHCEQLGIRWTQSNSRNISISHRESVAKLDTFIGPKT